MTQQDLKETEIAVVFHSDGCFSTIRNIIDTTAYNQVKQIFIMDENTPVYKLSNYVGYNTIDEKWKEVK